MTEATAFPLAWPGFRPHHKGARLWPPFRSAGKVISLPAARDRLSAELNRLDARSVVLSTNLELKSNGQPRAGRGDPADPGVACYFHLKGKPLVLACDRWTSVAGNIAAIAAHIEALRGQERWGVGTVEQAFAGYAALPAPLSPDDWRAVLKHPTTLAEAEAIYRSAMRTAHPDAGGSTAQAAALNTAIDLARQVLK